MATIVNILEKKDIKNKIIENNNLLSKLLMDNMKLQQEYFMKFNESVETTLRYENKISIPSTPITRKDDFIREYGWKYTIKSYQRRANMSYLLQYNEFISYLLDNFQIYGSISRLLLYSQQNNLVFIIEVLCKEIVSIYRKNCSECYFLSRGCEKIFNNKDSITKNLFKLIERLNNNGIILLTDDEIEVLRKAIDARNNIHLVKTNTTTYYERNIDEKIYKSLKSILIKINESLIKINKNSEVCSSKI